MHASRHFSPAPQLTISGQSRIKLRVRMFQGGARLSAESEGEQTGSQVKWGLGGRSSNLKWPGSL